MIRLRARKHSNRPHMLRRTGGLCFHLPLASPAGVLGLGDAAGDSLLDAPLRDKTSNLKECNHDRPRYA